MVKETVELFSGKESFSKYARKLGYKTYTVDIDSKFSPDLVCDLLNGIPEVLAKKIDKADIVWMSPPCTTFSMASGFKHWDIKRQPKTKEAQEGLILLTKCWSIAKYLESKNKIFFIENPLARARWFLPNKYRHTVWYCKYGDNRAKPTDIWTNLKGWQPKICKNNGLCHHIRSPRGSRTGTQGLKSSENRGEIPEGLFKELFITYERTKNE